MTVYWEKKDGSKKSEFKNSEITPVARFSILRTHLKHSAQIPKLKTKKIQITKLNEKNDMS